MSQDNSIQKAKVVPPLTNDLIKVAVIFVFVASVVFLINSHSDCWFSINCHPSIRGGHDVSTILVGLLTTFVLTTVFGTPAAPAIVIGALAWAILKFWL